MSASTTYSLKTMIMARALAEISVLIILSILPLILFLTGHFFVIHIILRSGVCILSPLSLLGLWGFGQVAFKVAVNEAGITTQSALKKHFLKWEDIRALKQVNRMGWREYCLVHPAGELSFPCLLIGCAELVETIRSRLPDRGRSTSGDAQIYKVQAISFLLECGKLLLQAGFAGLFFCFHDSLKKGGKVSAEDIVFVLVLAVLFSAAVLWKFFQFFRLPREVQLASDGLTLRGFFSSAKIAWSDITKVAAAGLLYPEGMIITAKKKKYLISNSIDAYDELAEEISQRSLKQAKA